MSTQQLRDLQEVLSTLIMGSTPIVDSEETDRLIAPSARGMSPTARLEVYRQQFWVRHLSNLQDDFPTLIWAMGGREAFCEVARDFLLARPPRHWDLQRLGEGLPRYLEGLPRWENDDLVRSAATLDWAFMEAFDASDAPPFEPGSLAAIPEDAWPSVKVVAHPSLRLLALHYRLHDVRELLAAGGTAVRPEGAVTPTVVWRDPTCALRAIAIEAAAFAVLSALQGGEPLGKACERATTLPSDEHLGSLEDRVGEWFQAWTTRGWICAVEPPVDLRESSRVGAVGDES